MLPKLSTYSIVARIAPSAIEGAGTSRRMSESGSSGGPSASSATPFAR